MILENKSKNSVQRTTIISLSCSVFQMRGEAEFIQQILIKEEYGRRMKKVITLLHMRTETLLRRCL